MAGRHVPPCPPPKSKKNIFGQLSCKIREISGKYHVQFGHFVNFSYIIFSVKTVLPPPPSPKLTQLRRLCFTYLFTYLIRLRGILCVNVVLRSVSHHVRALRSHLRRPTTSHGRNAHASPALTPAGNDRDVIGAEHRNRKWR